MLLERGLHVVPCVPDHHRPDHGTWGSCMLLSSTASWARSGMGTLMSLCRESNNYVIYVKNYKYILYIKCSIYVADNIVLALRVV